LLVNTALKLIILLDNLPQSILSNEAGVAFLRLGGEWLMIFQTKSLQHQTDRKSNSVYNLQQAINIKH
jgi:hypothetical protein